MTQESLETSESPAVRAAVAQERRFQGIEHGLAEHKINFDNFLSMYARDQEEARKESGELRSLVEQTLANTAKTNGSVADALLKIATNAEIIEAHSADISELSSGLQAQRQQNADTAGKVGALDKRLAAATHNEEIDGAEARGFWKGLSMPWKILGGAVVVSGALVALAANLTTLVHTFLK